MRFFSEGTDYVPTFFIVIEIMYPRPDEKPGSFTFANIVLSIARASVRTIYPGETSFTIVGFLSELGVGDVFDNAFREMI